MAGVGVGNWIGGPDVHSDGHRTKELDGPSVGDRTVGQGDPSTGEESDDAEYDTDLEVPAGYGQGQKIFCYDIRRSSCDQGKNA